MSMTRNAPKLTYEGAAAILEAAAEKARSMKLPICIAVVDEGGHLLAFARKDDAKPSSAVVAITKATSAALRRSPTGPLPDAEHVSVLLSLGMPLASGGKLTCVRGGLPIVWDGTVVGGLGISAGTEQQDEEVARAGLAALSSGAGRR
ncbi:MAG TPA: heme-binding protein [Terriglobia bacterium]|nr:heme-binding protein [Terriglobia bacterium]